MASTINNQIKLAGMMSGLDTEALVKSMSAATKSRINSKKQKLQSLEWKQESYRSIIDKVSDFKNKYLDITKSTSIKANAVMKKCVATSSRDKVISATASAGATPAKYTIKKAIAAKTASISTTGAAAEGAIKLDFSNAVNGKNYEVRVKLDGAEKTIVFTGGASADATQASFLAAANNAFSGIKGINQNFEMDGSWLKFNSQNDGVYHTFDVSASAEGLGLAADRSSKITTASKLGSIGFEQALTTDNGRYNININGRSFEFTDNDTVSDVISAINNADIGVKMTFSNVSQSFTLETKNTGAGQQLQVYQTSGNLLNALFNIDSATLGTSSADSARIEYNINATYTQAADTRVTDKLKAGFDSGDAEAQFDFTVKLKDSSGTETTYNLVLDMSALTKKPEGESYSESEISTALQNAFSRALKDATGDENFTTDIRIGLSGGNFSVSSSDYRVEFGANELGLESGNTNERTVVGDEMYVIADNCPSTFVFRRNGEDFTFDFSGSSRLTIGDLVDSGLFTLRNDGTLVANAEISGGDDFTRNLLNRYFGKDTLSPATASDTLTATGSNATLVLSSDGENFTTYTSASNVFTFDGTNINVNSAKDFRAASPDDYITVETEKDVSSLKELITDFVNDYNKLLEDLYGETSTQRPKSSGSYYDPLTEEQEEEMSDKEIEKWNENAKKGLLYNDSNVLRLASDLRSAMSTFVDKYGLYNMGIKLTDNWRDNGKLEIDEAKLETAIKSDTDKIAELFTGENGLSAKLESAIDKAISTKTKKYGYLTALAGQKGTKTDTDNQIYKQIKSIKDIIDRLNEKYEAEQERYWKRFTALETYMSKMQQQSSYIWGDGSTDSSSQQ